MYWTRGCWQQSQCPSVTDKSETKAPQPATDKKTSKTGLASLKIAGGFYFKVNIFKNIFIVYAITVVPFPATLTPLHSAYPLPPTVPPYSSCPWVILLSSLASTFPPLFLPSPCLFSTYHLCSLFSVPFPTLYPPNPLLITLHVISISVVLFLF